MPCCQQYPENEFVGDMTLSTQAEVVAFGANNYTKVTGNLTIEGTVESLVPLRALQRVSGTVLIHETTLLESLDGLQCLWQVGVTLEITGNLALVSIAQLQSLKTVAEFLSIYLNPLLVEFGSFASVCSLNNVAIFSNDALTSINAFNSCKLKTVSEVEMRNMNLLTSICAFKHVTSCDNMYVCECALLETVSVAPHLASAQRIEFRVLPVLSKIAGFCLLASLENITFFDLAVLERLPTFPLLEEVSGTILIDTMPALINIDGFSALQSTGSLLVSACGITNVDALVNLTEVTTALNFTLCPSLTNVDGLSALVNVAAPLVTFSTNVALADFCGLQPLAAIDPSGAPTFDIVGNASNPDKTAIAALEPCDLCAIAERVLQRWVDDAEIAATTRLYFVYGISQKSIRYAARSGAVTAEQEHVLYGLLALYAGHAGTSVASTNMVCADEPSAFNFPYLRFEVGSCRRRRHH